METGWNENYVLFDKELIPSLCLVVESGRRAGLNNLGKVEGGRRGWERDKTEM